MAPLTFSDQATMPDQATNLVPCVICGELTEAGSVRLERARAVAHNACMQGGRRARTVRNPPPEHTDHATGQPSTMTTPTGH